MKQPSAEAREEGVVLVLVIVLISLVVGSAYAFARSSLLDVMSARQRMDRVRADLLARSGTEMGVRALIEDLSSTDPLAQAIESPRDTWQILGAEPIEIPDVGELRIEIEDAGRRIPLNALVGGEPGQGLQASDQKEFLTQALKRIIENMPGRPEEKRYDIDEIADGIIDWIDSDDQTRLGDVEVDFYRNRRSEAPLPNRPIFSLGELMGVPGLDERLLEAMDSYFSPPIKRPRFAGAGLNPNTAPPHVLALVYIVGTGSFLEDEEVYRVLKARQDGQIFCPGQSAAEDCTDFAATVNLPGETLFPPITYESSVFMVRSRAQVGDATACVATVVDRSDPEKLEPLSYRLDC